MTDNGREYQGEQGGHGDLSFNRRQDSSTEEIPTASYIEFNDGSVCWYYPIFPPVAPGPGNSQAAVATREDNEDLSTIGNEYSYNGPDNADGDNAWEYDEYFVEDEEWYRRSLQGEEEPEMDQNPGNVEGSLMEESNLNLYYKYMPFNGSC